MNDDQKPFLRKQAWDYFNTHASQRMAAFNFYIGLSSLIITGYFASFKVDSNIQSARPLLAFLLCFLAFVFWKLDQRNKSLIKNAERALKYFEQGDAGDDVTKVFTQEEKETETKIIEGWRKVFFWRLHLSYSDCFNSVFLIFFLCGFAGLLYGAWHLVPWHSFCICFRSTHSAGSR